MKRRIAVVGDTLTGGGQVLDYGPEFGFLFLGHKAALIGNKAYCETCKSVGIIAKAGGSSRMFDLTQEIALDGDFVLCQCPEHPRIKASLAGESWCEDGDSGAASAKSVPIPASPISEDEEIIEQSFSLLENGQIPIDGFHYDLYYDDELHTQREEYSSEGETVRIPGHGTLKLVTWLAKDSARRE